MTLSDLERLSKIFNDTKRRAVCLRQLSCLFVYSLNLFNVFIFLIYFVFKCKCIHSYNARCANDYHITVGIHRTNLLKSNIRIAALYCEILLIDHSLRWSNSILHYSFRRRYKKYSWLSPVALNGITLIDYSAVLL